MSYSTPSVDAFSGGPDNLRHYIPHQFLHLDLSLSINLFIRNHIYQINVTYNCIYTYISIIMSEILHIFHQPPPSHHQMHSHLQRDLLNAVESQLVNCSFESDFGRFEETDLIFQCSDHQFDGTGVFNCLSGSSVDELSKVTAVTEKNHTTRKRKPEIVDCDSGLIGPPKARKTALNGNSKPKTEQKPDYVHVRARRGQATDSHSLAERARRDRIKRKMQVLQDLVPGCNKTTSKAAILDEIITYVQSLQRDVEFLTMKLAASASCVDFNVDNLFPAE